MTKCAVGNSVNVTGLLRNFKRIILVTNRRFENQ